MSLCRAARNCRAPVVALSVAYATKHGCPYPLKDPKKRNSQNDPLYYVGESKGLSGGSVFLDLLGGLGDPCISCEV